MEHSAKYLANATSSKLDVALGKFLINYKVYSSYSSSYSKWYNFKIYLNLEGKEYLLDHLDQNNVVMVIVFMNIQVDHFLNIVKLLQ